MSFDILIIIFHKKSPGLHFIIDVALHRKENFIAVKSFCLDKFIASSYLIRLVSFSQTLQVDIHGILNLPYTLDIEE